jgi:hypothetical protein
MDERSRPSLSPRFCCYAITPNAPERKPADISMVETARPGFEGSMFRSNRTSAGSTRDAAGR